MEKPRRLVAGSVNPAALTVLEKMAEQRLGEPVAVVGRDIPLPIATTLPEPEKIGVDRLCCAAAAFQRLQQPCVVADFGTAVTIDCVNPDGVFIGGAILPGLTLQAAALHDRTAQLPQVEPVNPDWVFGRNTNEAIVGGIVYGLRGAMRELVESYATELAVWPTVITTGGDAELIGLQEGIVQAIVPELNLIGIALAFYKSLPPEEDQAYRSVPLE
jgi:type III pantothenate kinase